MKDYLDRIDKTIKILEGENDLILFDPMTGESKTVSALDDFNRDCYFAHVFCIHCLRRYRNFLTPENLNL